MIVDLPNELDQRMAEKGPDHLFEIILVHLVHLRSDLERQSRPLRNLDRSVGPFFWRDPAKKSEVISATYKPWPNGRRQPVVNGRDPTGTRRHGCALAFRNRN